MFEAQNSALIFIAVTVVATAAQSASWSKVPCRTVIVDWSYSGNTAATFRMVRPTIFPALVLVPQQVGIAVHQGQEYGPVNRYVILAGCISIVLLAATGAPRSPSWRSWRSPECSIHWSVFRCSPASLSKGSTN
jgi:uncharacterized iron-regulated membrane protein